MYGADGDGAGRCGRGVLDVVMVHVHTSELSGLSGSLPLGSWCGIGFAVAVEYRMQGVEPLKEWL